MDSTWIDNPWLVQICGGIISGLVVGLLLQLIASQVRSREGKSSATVQIIQNLGYIFLAPFFIMAFLFSIPLFAGLYLTESARWCRFTPTCKEYLVEAIEVHGLIGGALLGIGRVLRCNGFVKKGTYDPVPPHRNSTVIEHTHKKPPSRKE
jgi:putative membrane protein insertion efficiency factor